MWCCRCSPYKQRPISSALGIRACPASGKSSPAPLTIQLNSFTGTHRTLKHKHKLKRTHKYKHKTIYWETIPITNKGNICFIYHWPGDHRHATTNHIPGKEPFVSSISKKSSIGENEQYPLTKLLQDKACRQNLIVKAFRPLFRKVQSITFKCI